MKRVIAALLTLTIAISFSGCGTGNSNNHSTSVPTETVAPTEIQLVETAPPETTIETVPVTLKRYPLNVDRAYVNLAQELPAHIYNTTGAENGLGGTVYAFSGMVEDYFSFTEEGITFENIIVKTDDGSVLISNHYKAAYNNSMLLIGADLTKALYPYNIDYYVFPEVGQAATFVAIYIGYSASEELPTFVLGANPSIFEMLEYDDPATVIDVPDPVSHQTGVFGDKLILGNLEFSIPDGFSVTIVNDNTFSLTSSDKECVFGLHATDISELSEPQAIEYLPMQHDAFMTEGIVRVNESDLEGIIAGFDLIIDFYGEMSEDLDITTCMDTSFTDSWYAYTIMFKCDPDADKASEYVTTFVEFISYSEYLGESPRFDYVQ